MKIILRSIFLLVSVTIAIFAFPTAVSAGWTSGYFKQNGTYVPGYWKTEPNYYKWDNYSFDNDWSDSYNDNSWYRSYGYDPEPLDDDYVSSYSRDYYWDSSYYNDDYYDDYDDYEYYNNDNYGSSYWLDW